MKLTAVAEEQPIFEFFQFYSQNWYRSPGFEVVRVFKLHLPVLTQQLVLRPVNNVILIMYHVILHMFDVIKLGHL